MTVLCSPQAALELSQRLHRGRFGWVFDADIKGFFDNIDHDWLIRMLEQRIQDRAFIGLIQKWLRAGMLEEDGEIVFPVSAKKPKVKERYKIFCCGSQRACVRRKALFEKICFGFLEYAKFGIRISSQNHTRLR